MLYFALSLILIGLFFLWKALVPENAPKAPPQNQPEPKPISRETRNFPHRKSTGALQKETPKPVVFQGREIEPFFSKPELNIDGVLYLDEKQSSRSLYRRRNRELPAKAYSAIHHIGKARLSTKGNTILVQSQNTSYHYPTADMDQIIFREKSITLLPHSLKQAAAIFLSREAKLLKDHVRTYSSGA